MLTNEQIELRSRGIGGSDAPAIFNLGRQTALDLYYQKRGVIEAPSSLEFEGMVGNFAETTIDEVYQHVSGNKTQRRDTRIHRAYPWMLGNIDRKIVGQRRLVDYKLRQWLDGWGEEGSADVPPDVYIQIQHYLIVFGYDIGEVFVWFGRFEFRRYFIPRDDELCRNLIEVEREFWARVQAEEDDPPEPDYQHPSTPDLLRRMYPGTDGGHVDLHESLVHWHEVLEQSKEKRRQYDETARAARAHILDAMEKNAIGILPDGRGYYTRKQTKAGWRLTHNRGEIFT